MMRAVRGTDTTPEIMVRRAAHRMGFRFRLHRQNLPGRPDLVFPKMKIALFVHGCFWHAHEGCSKASVPASNVAFWETKLSQNVERDRRVQGELRSRGWNVAVIWECQIKNPAQLQMQLQQILCR